MPVTPNFRVLSVDDDAEACAMLSALLMSSGINCRCAASAAEAWTLIRADQFDLYLLDAWLPGVDGFEFCRQLRAIDSITPIIFYSGAAYESDKQKGIAAGANAYIVKPEVEVLVAAMSGLIAKAREAEMKPRSSPVRNPMDANRQAAQFDLFAASAGSSV